MAFARWMSIGLCALCCLGCSGDGSGLEADASVQQDAQRCLSRVTSRRLLAAAAPRAKVAFGDGQLAVVYLDNLRTTTSAPRFQIDVRVAVFRDGERTPAATETIATSRFTFEGQYPAIDIAWSGSEYLVAWDDNLEVSYAAALSTQGRINAGPVALHRGEVPHPDKPGQLGRLTTRRPRIAWSGDRYFISLVGYWPGKAEVHVSYTHVTVAELLAARQAGVLDRDPVAAPGAWTEAQHEAVARGAQLAMGWAVRWAGGAADAYKLLVSHTKDPARQTTIGAVYSGRWEADGLSGAPIVATQISDAGLLFGWSGGDRVRLLAASASGKASGSPKTLATARIAGERLEGLRLRYSEDGTLLALWTAGDATSRRVELALVDADGEVSRSVQVEGLGPSITALASATSESKHGDVGPDSLTIGTERLRAAFWAIDADKPEARHTLAVAELCLEP